MSNYETKPNTGSIFKNDKKESDKHPDYRGKINVDGKEKEIALWVKESAKGLKYFSVSISEPYVKPQGTPTMSSSTANESQDLPF
jgi:uncharacterized protein (DUF736 family)